ncbi:hypothetical protein LZ31DRAFT_600496 [Colletotrichum somersetense]|nr:hypothetical protein LZ31DRAFT_600496 [Colletotrichum somersetense]
MMLSAFYLSVLATVSEALVHFPVDGRDLNITVPGGDDNLVFNGTSLNITITDDNDSKCDEKVNICDSPLPF